MAQPCALPGIDKFLGQVMHSKVYRHPEVMQGHKVAVIGAGPTGFDIILEIAPFATEVGRHLRHLNPKRQKLIGFVFLFPFIF